ncbi:hypothetical protein SAMN05518871_107201 [Psychrobacillus sp. OK028]|uniref:hypothetical protein n=1 Tax=Psychrobacillus sp. OK028 TaxID=1884359 RepID=UPI00087E8E8A|nr:hypothetical protein [Psychrobacillus sp. OK028]SDN78301.1 hypothetical protein SAMN05518871_107201 [Psychrobacillus sp. OK028]
MSKEKLLRMLETLCKFNNVQIQYTFSTDDQPQITVKCVKHSRTIEITYLASQTIKLFDNFEEAVAAIQQIINAHASA